MPDETCWTLIEAAGAGDREAGDHFAARYAPAVRAYLGARWGAGPLAAEVEDAQQEVFVECLKEGGVLERVRRGTAGGFRAYLYGVVRNVAGRAEERRRRAFERGQEATFHPELTPAAEATLSQVFDRAFAQGVLRQAVELHGRRAREQGGDALTRLELLRQRFQEGLAIAAIASRQGADAAQLHHAYARAREEFHACLREVVGFHHPGATTGEIDRECRQLVELVEN